MPIPRKVVIECPKCDYAKVVIRGDSLPDASMFQKCPKCGEMMMDSEKSVEDVSGVFGALFGLFERLKK